MAIRSELNDKETEVLDITNEIKSLNRQKSNLSTELNQLIEKVSKAKEELINTEGKIKEVMDNAQICAQKIKDDASVLYDKVKVKDNELNKNIGELNKKNDEVEVLKKQAQDLIKSNEGREKIWLLPKAKMIN